MSSLDSVECRTDFGLVGDRHAKQGGKGQVTLVAREELDESGAMLGTTIQPGATRRNITLAGVRLPQEKGRRLRIGGALLEVTGPAAPCGLMDTCIMPGARAALEGRSGVRARVIEGATLRVGDAATVEAVVEERSA